MKNQQYPVHGVNGHDNPEGCKQIAVRFEPKQFHEIDAFARERNISFAAAVRSLSFVGMVAVRSEEERQR